MRAGGWAAEGSGFLREQELEPAWRLCGSTRVELFDVRRVVDSFFDSTYEVGVASKNRDTDTPRPKNCTSHGNIEQKTIIQV